MPPLILTLALEHAAQERFDALRRRHFPPERNHIAAHLTLFHALPGEQEDRVRADLADAADRAPFTLRVAGVRSLGRGVAYVLVSDELAALRAELAGRWQPWLTAQDRQPHSPHVTVQNKVAPATARALLADLQRDFVPHDVSGRALALWRYLGGPWEPLALQMLSGAQ